VVEPMAAEPAPELVVEPPAFGSIAGVDRGVCFPGKLEAEAAGTAGAKLVCELVTVSTLEDETGSAAERLVDGLSMVSKMQGE